MDYPFVPSSPTTRTPSLADHQPGNKSQLHKSSKKLSFSSSSSSSNFIDEHDLLISSHDMVSLKNFYSAPSVLQSNPSSQITAVPVLPVSKQPAQLCNGGVQFALSQILSGKLQTIVSPAEPLLKNPSAASQAKPATPHHTLQPPSSITTPPQELLFEQQADYKHKIEFPVITGPILAKLLEQITFKSHNLIRDRKLSLNISASNSSTVADALPYFKKEYIPSNPSKKVIPFDPIQALCRNMHWIARADDPADLMQMSLEGCREQLSSPVSSRFTTDNMGLHSRSASQLYQKLKQADTRYKLLIVDCRYSFEYRGGHIPSAINISSPTVMKNLFATYKESMFCEPFIDGLLALEGKEICLEDLECLQKRVQIAHTGLPDQEPRAGRKAKVGACNSSVSTLSTSAQSLLTAASDRCEQQDKKCIPVVIFHCEFSSQRAPNMWRLVRELDRSRNEYPALDFPQTYVLQGGYEAFVKAYGSSCSPPHGYVEMTAKEWLHELDAAVSKKRDEWTEVRRHCAAGVALKDKLTSS